MGIYAKRLNLLYIAKRIDVQALEKALNLGLINEAEYNEIIV